MASLESAFYRAYVESAEQAIAWTDLELRFRYVNPAMAELLGVPAPSMLIGTALTDLLDDASCQQLRAEILPTLDHRDIWVGELGFRERRQDDGSLTPSRSVHTRFTLLRGDQGRPQGISASFLDVTQRKIADASSRRQRARVDEQLALDGRDPEGMVEKLRQEIEQRQQTELELDRQRTLLEAVIMQTPIPMVLVSAPDMVIRMYNKATRETLKLDDEPDQTGRRIFEFNQSWRDITLDGEPMSLEKSPLALALRGIRTEQLEYRSVVKDGTLRHFVVDGVPIYDKQGELIAGLLLFPDISERVQHEAERRKLEEQLQQSQKLEAIGRLAGGVAHDFNNILTGISGYAEILLRKLGPGHPIAGGLEEILGAVDRAAGLTQQLLAFSRKQVIEPRVVDIREVIERSQRMLQRIIGEDVTLTYRHLSEEPSRILADPSQLDQVLVNLAVNARDAMPQGGRLSIETANSDLDEAFCVNHAVPPGPYVMLAVGDTGVGMDQQTKDKIFEPFFTTKGKEQGTGLGLATVYGVVRQNKGFIDVYSEPGLGTTIKIHLPRVFGNVEKERGPVATDKRPRGTETVMLVEDEEMVRNLVQQMLQLHGYKVVVASCGVDACQAVAHLKERIALLLTDVVMPDMNGRELFDRLKNGRPDLEVVFMSGYTQNIIAERGVLERGMHFLMKPFSIDDLLQKVRQVLDADHGGSGSP